MRFGTFKFYSAYRYPSASRTVPISCKLTYINTSEKKCTLNCLTTSNFKLDGVFSDVFGKSATRIIDKLFEQGNSDFDARPLLDSKCRATVDEVSAALDGEFNDSQDEKLKIIRKHQECISRLRSSLKTTVFRLSEKFQSQIHLLISVPGISTVFTVIRILSEIGADMSVFETSKQLISWAGICPGNSESGGKKKIYHG